MKLLNKISDKFLKKLSVHHVYFFSMALCVSSLFTITIKGIDISSSLLVIGLTLSCIVLCWEICKYLIKTNKNISILSILSALASGAFAISIAQALSLHIINEVTNMHPVYFVNSSKIITSLLTPIIWLYILAFLLAIYYLLQISFNLIKGLKRIVVNSKRPLISLKDITDEVARPIATVVLVIVLSQSPEYLLSHSLSKTLARFIVVQSDFYLYGTCNNISSKERYALLDQDNIAVVKGFKDNFEIKKCNI